ncbi:hypothetical protein [Sphingomonas sp. S2M10]|uniref:hypothetical protein n=1 Tax=Sphingomonas sp. S2M10 TaxID=2705010 RepID=UPI001456E64E|nr:hypothetical protein [Sphingomonas sp. S2M10]
MAFHNEYVDSSSDEAKEYNLDGVRRSFHRPLDTRYSWTIDRDRRIFLMWIKGGREEFYQRQNFCLWWKGCIISLDLLQSENGFSDTTWDLVSSSFTIPEGVIEGRDKIVSLLKEALIEYKHAGIGMDVPDHKATFLF